jgi:hypothetical protein
MNETASVKSNSGPPLSAVKRWPCSSKSTVSRVSVPGVRSTSTMRESGKIEQ